MNSNFFDINEKIMELASKADEMIAPVFKTIEAISLYNGQKVLEAFIKNKVAESHFKGTTGYGYDDRGREILDSVFAQVMGAEDALVRSTFVNGTHALSTALFGILRPGQTLLSVTGKPYDTLEKTIGIKGEGCGSLKEYGINYRELNLKADGTVDYESLKDLASKADVFYIQRSRGYSLRPSVSVGDIERIVSEIKKADISAIVMVDNCYGEFVEKYEPTDVGADLIAGSLIKNPGGGIVTTGGYIAGRSELVEKCAYRLTAPGLGREVGSTGNMLREMFLGLFLAPQAVESALKTAVFAAFLFEQMGYEVFPRYNEKRSDIIQAIKAGNKEELIKLCQGVQKGSPVDSFALPMPWAMPGYDDEVIMAAGAFTMGASIELSCDAPIREPFAAYLQGGLTYPTGRMGVLMAADNLYKK